jgi:hypothetical protein
MFDSLKSVSQSLISVSLPVGSVSESLQRVFETLGSVSESLISDLLPLGSDCEPLQSVFMSLQRGSESLFSYLVADASGLAFAFLKKTASSSLITLSPGTLSLFCFTEEYTSSDATKVSLPTAVNVF